MKCAEIYIHGDLNRLEALSYVNYILLQYSYTRGGGPWTATPARTLDKISKHLYEKCSILAPLSPPDHSFARNQLV